MRIAIAGAGIAGLTAAHLLHRAHDITVFEAADYAGGHTRTVDAEQGGRRYAVDTGFIVFNDWTYPNFERLLAEIGVASQPSSMSFSVRDEGSGLEYNGTTLNSLFAQRRNLLRPSFWRMILDILRFHRRAPRLLEGPESETEPALGDVLRTGRYSRPFVENYLLPMASAIWSSDPGRILSFPARTFVRFFHNHGMLSVSERPTWRVVKGGSRVYVEALTRPFLDRIRLSTPVERIRRHSSHVEVTPRGGETERFDEVVLAAHADQSLAMLADPSPAEREILEAMPFQENAAALHTDERLLPRRRLAWAAWNYHRLREGQRVAVTYDMNILQSLDSARHFLVTLNREGDIDASKVIARMTWHHPLYTPEGMRARARHGEISGRNRTHYCGAYWGYGFHEDGVKSALRVCRGIGGS